MNKLYVRMYISFFFFNDTATTEIYTLSLHDALPIYPTTIPEITMPTYIKLTALAVTILGFTLALELSLITHNLKLEHPTNTFKFSNLLGYYPTIIHRLPPLDRKSTRLNSSHANISYAVFCL